MAVTATVTLSLVAAGCGPFGGSSLGPAPGTIVFGSAAHRVSAYQWTVKSPHSNFRDGKWIGWVAQLKQPLGATMVEVVVKDAATNRVTWDGEAIGLDPKFVQLASQGAVPVDSFDKAGQAGPVPGKYVLEYVSGNVILAQGTFRITR